MITIGQLARYAGVTTKAVRVYHERALMAEPARDSSGYRRYRAEDAIRLVKIKTLARAGVPLERIRYLLDADPALFDAAIGEIDQGLQERVRQLQNTRKQLSQLRAGEGLYLSREVTRYLDRLCGLGVSERAVGTERDIWVLLQSVAPEQAEVWLADKLDGLHDPEFRALYQEHDAAFDWDPEDPRLPDLADRTSRWLARRGVDTSPTSPTLEPDLIGLVQEAVATRSPAWERLFRRTKGKP